MIAHNDFPADLTHLNTMALRSHAKRHITLNAISEVLPLFSELQATQTPYVILSGGSNTILPPTLNATVISPIFSDEVATKVLHENDTAVTLEVMAGEIWHDFVVACTQNGWYGLENMALIPGRVGSCPVQNIGAYGVQVADVIDRVTAFHIPTMTWQTLTNAACNFGYRDSIFKQQAGDWLIASVTFNLSKIPNPTMNYGDVATIATQLAQNSEETNNPLPSPVDVMNAIIQIRSSKLPTPDVLANCGSFFKNPIVKKSLVENLLKTYPTLVYYPTDDNEKIKVSGGWLIEHAGLKGKGIAPILTHDKQALVLTNHNPQHATQADIETTVKFIRDSVFGKFGIMLEPEPVWVSEQGNSGMLN